MRRWRGTPLDGKVSAGLAFLAFLVVTPITPVTGAGTTPPPLLLRLGVLADSLADAGAWTAADSLARRGLVLARDELSGTRELAAWLVRAAGGRLDLGRPDEADSLLHDALSILATPAAADPARTLTARRLLARSAAERGDLEAAEREAAACLEDPAATAIDAARLAVVRLTQDRTEEASHLLDKAEQMLLANDRARGATSDPPDREPDAARARATILEVRAQLAIAAGDWGPADSLYTSALRMRERDSGTDHPAIIRALRGLADVRQRRGDFAGAEELHRRGLRIVEDAGGHEHPRVADFHNDLGVLLRRAGDYPGSIAEYRESLRIRIGLVGEEDAEVALTMVNLSAVLEAVGETAEGMEMLRRAVRILEAVHGPEHSRTAWALSHLAQRERGQGNADEAERLFERSLAIARRLHGDVHPDVASYLVGVAQCQTDLGLLEDAARSFEEAAAIGRETMGADNALVTRYERELGVVLVLLGRLDEGRDVLEQCVAKLEEQLGPTHPALVRCLSGLTVASLLDGKLEEATARADRRLAIAEARFGESGLRGSLLMQLAVAVATGRFEDAMTAGMRGARIALASQDDVIAQLSEREALEHAAVHRRAIGALLAALVAGPDPSDIAVATVFSQVVHGHGRILDRLAERQTFLEIRRTSPELDALGAAYRDAVDELASRIARGPRGKPDDWAADVDRLRTAKEDAERALASASDRFRRSIEEQGRERAADLDALAAALPEGTQLVHFVRFPTFSVGTPDWKPGATSLTGSLFSGRGERYGAFRLAADAGGSARVTFHDLGDAAHLDSLVADCRRAAEIPPGRLPSPREEAEWRAASRRLQDALWAPVAPDGSEPLFVVPTSALHGVDFHALLDDDGSLVIEKRRVHLLSSAHDLLRPAAAATGAIGRVLVVGDPRTEDVPDLCPDGGERPPLPGAADEARRVAALLEPAAREVTLLVGDAATEAAVRAAATGCTTIHLATHGFFCAELDVRRGIAGEKLAASPLVQCGLVLGSGGSDDAGSSDGLWTAQEIVALDLHGLGCVILSACDSGLGRLAPGEGLLGLRRAFEMAGARTVVMALGRVPDATTRDLVTRLHELRLAGRPTSEALWEAERERLATARQRGRVHPARWGGFVVEGDWR